MSMGQFDQELADKKAVENCDKNRRIGQGDVRWCRGGNNYCGGGVLRGGWLLFVFVFAAAEDLLEDVFLLGARRVA